MSRDVERFVETTRPNRNLDIGAPGISGCCEHPGFEFDVATTRPTLEVTMNDSLSLSCPHCGESFSLALDVSEGSAEFTVDCEVCCRPMKVTVQINNGEIEGLDVEEE